MSETLPESENLSLLGEKLLDDLGCGDLKDLPSLNKDGSLYLLDGNPVAIKDFLLICGDHVTSMVHRFNSLNPDSEEYKNVAKALKFGIQMYAEKKEIKD